MDKKLEKVISTSKSMAEQIRDLALEIEKIEDEKSKRDEEIVRLKSEIKEATIKADLEKEKAINAEKLKNEVYAPLIHDLFDTPKQELIESVVSESNKSGTKAAYWAIGSIVISLLFSAYSYYSSIKNGKIIEEEILNLSKASERNLTLFQSLWPEEYLRSGIVELLKELSSDFNDYSTKNDVALFFTMRFIDKFPQSKNSQFIECLKAFNKSAYIPSDDDITIWNDEVIKRYNRVLVGINKEIDTLNLDVILLNDYKRQNDIVDFGNWGYYQMTKTEMIENITSSRNAAQLYKNSNTNRTSNTTPRLSSN